MISITWVVSQIVLGWKGDAMNVISTSSAASYDPYPGISPVEGDKFEAIFSTHVFPANGNSSLSYFKAKWETTTVLGESFLKNHVR